jgi:hypothetical protein
VRHRRVVASTLARSRRLLALAGAALAVGFLVAMTISGRVRASGQFVRFVAAGVLSEAPAQVSHIELIGTGRRWVFTRNAERGWRRDPDQRPVLPPLATHLDDALKFLHTSAPVRTLDRQEWAEHGLVEFGLDRPALSAVLSNGGQRVLAVHFGSTNPQKVLQYMRIDGRDEVYVMSRFVGQEWERALAEVEP